MYASLGWKSWFVLLIHACCLLNDKLFIHCSYGVGIKYSRRTRSIQWLLIPSDPFYLYGLTLIPTWIDNHIPSKVWDEITDPFQNFSGATVELWEWINNFIPPFIIIGCNYSPMLVFKFIHISKRGPWWHKVISSQVLSLSGINRSLSCQKWDLYHLYYINVEELQKMEYRFSINRDFALMVNYELSFMYLGK